jgi:Ca-activated chloride channel homolog
MTFHFAHFYFFLFGLLSLGLGLLLKIIWPQQVVYRYSLVHLFVKHRMTASFFQKYIFSFLRLVSLILMVILMGKPQFVDQKSKAYIEGIDIVLTLDVSGSMKLFDDLKDRRPRWDVVQKEALRFIEKRENDAIGLVIFGQYAITRCPITNDKKVLQKIVNDLYIGSTSQDMPNGTMLFQGLVAAVRRLQSSKANSKIIVLLTDGAPSQGDIAYEDAMNIAKQIGVKIYTIGVGGDHGGLYDDGFFGVRSAGGNKMDKKLLTSIAQETGGKFFEARNPEEVKRVYQEIDELETTKHEIDIYKKYYDYFLPFLWALFYLLLLELFLRVFVWFRL